MRDTPTEPTENLDRPAAAPGRKKPRRIRRIRRFLYRTALFCVVLLSLALGAILLLVPWLAQRGDLNAVFEEFLSSALAVPVRIETIDTEPLSRITLTRMRSVSAEAGTKLRFAAEEISFFYDPVELLSGSIHKVEFKSPNLFLNFDEPLAGVFRVPQAPQPQETEPPEQASAPSSPAELPFDIGQVVVDSGDVTLQFAKRRIPVRDLRIEFLGLGKKGEQSYQLNASVFGATLSVFGKLKFLPAVGGVFRYGLYNNRVLIKGLSLTRLRTILAAGESGAADETLRRYSELVQSGSLNLTGRLDGTWPDRFKIDLRSSADDVNVNVNVNVNVDTGESAEAAFLSDGEFGLTLRADVQGLFSTVDFDIELRAGGKLSGVAKSRSTSPSQSSESATLKAKGRFLRTKDKDGELIIEQGEASLAQRGRVHFTGHVASLLDLTPRYNFSVELAEVDAARILDYIPERVQEEWPLRETLRAVTASGQAKLQGSSTDIAAEGELKLPRVTLPVDVQQPPVADVTARFRGLRLKTDLTHARLESADFVLGAFDLAPLSSWIAERAPGVSQVRGQVNVQCGARDWTCSSDALRGRTELTLAVSQGEVQLTEELEGIFGIDGKMRWTCEIDSRGSETPFTATASATIREILVGNVYAEVPGETWTARVEGKVRSGDAGGVEEVTLRHFQLATPLTGTATGHARVRWEPELSEFHISAQTKLTDIPTARAFDTFVRSPYANVYAFLEDARLTGKPSVFLATAGPIGRPNITGRLVLDDGTVALGAWSGKGLQVDLPFELGPGSDATNADGATGLITIRRLQYGPLETANLALPLRLSEGSYELTEKVAIPFLKGTVEVASLSFSPRAAKGLLVTASCNGTEISLAEIAKHAGWPAVEGDVSFQFAPLKYQGGELDVTGELTARAFGGHLTVRDFFVEDVLEPYGRLLVGEGRLEDLRMHDLGQTFRLGLFSGVLRGRLENLEFAAGELAAFRLDLETVRTKGVPQFVDRRGVETLRRVLAEELGRLEKGLFSKFYYDYFGFRCSLARDVFRLHGNRRHGDVEYIMYARWYQIPRIEIVNAVPGRAYDWQRFLDSLAAVFTEHSE